MINFFKKYNKKSVSKKAILKKNFIPFDLGKMLRIGNNKDGGYLVSKNGINNCKFLLSLGVGFNWSFEKKFMQLKNSEDRLVICYDNSISKEILREYSAKNFFRIFYKPSFKAIQRSSKYLDFKKLFDSKKAIHIKKNIDSEKSDSTETLNNIFQNLENNNLLKVDIEGSEYKILDQIINNFNKMSVLIIEFHNLSDKKNKEKFEFFFEKISDSFYLSHLHMNNANGIALDNFPDTIELTFEKKYILNNIPKRKIESFPLNNLDFPNSKNTNDYNLVFE